MSRERRSERITYAPAEPSDILRTFPDRCEVDSPFAHVGEHNGNIVLEAVLSVTLEELRSTMSNVISHRAALRVGVAAVDEHLPVGGLAPGVHEVWPGGQDAPHAAAAALFAGFALGQATERAARPVIWTLRRQDLFAPALAEIGLPPDRVIYAEAGDETSVLAVAEEALRYRGLAGVVCEVAKLSLKSSRRLQLAAETTGTVCFVLRRLRLDQTETAGTSCLTRWRVKAVPSRAAHGLPRAAWHVALTRCRGGQPGSWLLEVDDEAAPHRLRLVETVAAGAVVADTGRAAA